MGGQLDGIFLAGSLPHEFIILIVTLFICLWLINFFFSLSMLYALESLIETNSLQPVQSFHFSFIASHCNLNVPIWSPLAA